MRHFLRPEDCYQRRRRKKRDLGTAPPHSQIGPRAFSMTHILCTTRTNCSTTLPCSAPVPHDSASANNPDFGHIQCWGSLCRGGGGGAFWSHAVCRESGKLWLFPSERHFIWSSSTSADCSCCLEKTLIKPSKFTSAFPFPLAKLFYGKYRKKMVRRTTV